jgi:hypothetical protein
LLINYDISTYREGEREGGLAIAARPNLDANREKNGMGDGGGWGRVAKFVAKILGHIDHKIRPLAGKTKIRQHRLSPSKGESYFFFKLHLQKKVARPRRTINLCADPAKSLTSWQHWLWSGKFAKHLCYQMAEFSAK